MNMKKILYILSLVFACFLVSCEDFLEAPSQSTLDESLIFSNPTLASSAIDGIKVPFGETNSYRGRFLTHYGANTDIEWINSSSTIICQERSGEVCKFSHQHRYEYFK